MIDIDWIKLVSSLRAILFNLLFLVYIFQLIVPIKQADIILGACGLLAFLISLPGLQNFYKIIIILFFSFSLIVMYVEGLFTWNAITYFSGMTNILVLLAYASFFAIPVVQGEYPKKIYDFFKGKVSSFQSIYSTYSIITFIICSVMSAPAIPTIQTTLSNFLKEMPSALVNKFQSMTLVRPFILTLLWSPVATLPIIAIYGTGAKPSILLPITFSLAIVLLVIDIITSSRKFKGIDEKWFFVEANDQSISLKDKISLVLFLVSILLFIGLILTLSYWLSYSILDAVVLMIIPYSFLWSLLLKRGKDFSNNFNNRLKTNVPKISAQVALFVGVSLFINVIDHSDISGIINSNVQMLSQSFGPLILFIISFVAFIMSWTGIIPQLVVVLVTQTLNINVIDVSPEWLALAILGGALTGGASSPFTMNANIVAVTLQDSPMNVVKQNFGFAFLLFFISTLLAIILEITFG